MPKLPRISARKLISAFERNGFTIDRQRGSHVVLMNANGCRIVIPYHKGDIALKTLKGILSDCDFTIEDFLKIL